MQIIEQYYKQILPLKTNSEDTGLMMASQVVSKISPRFTSTRNLLGFSLRLYRWRKAWLLDVPWSFKRISTGNGELILKTFENT